jgi:hypothetical protein
MSTQHKPTLRCTKDYDLFEMHPYNRNVDKTKYLEKSMRSFGFDPGFPVRCIRNGSGRLKITHGHHRFHVARKLGIPVFFIEANNDIPIFDSEMSTRPWDITDFTVARARAGEPEAEKVLQYQEQTGIPIGSCISLLGGELAGSRNRSRSLKAGSYKAGSTNYADLVGEIVIKCKDLGVAFAAKAAFVSAISKCVLIKEFDVDLFLHKVRKHISIMEPRSNANEYLDLIEMVYNRQSQKRIPLAFLAREAAANRKLFKV